MSGFLLILLVMMVVFLGSSAMLFYGDVICAAIWSCLCSCWTNTKRELSWLDEQTQSISTWHARQEEPKRVTSRPSEEELAAERAFKDIRARQRALFAQQRQDLIDFEYELTGIRPNDFKKYHGENATAFIRTGEFDFVPVEAYVEEKVNSDLLPKEFDRHIENVRLGIETVDEVREAIGVGPVVLGKKNPVRDAVELSFAMKPPIIPNMGGPLGRLPIPPPGPPERIYR